MMDDKDLRGRASEIMAELRDKPRYADKATLEIYDLCVTAAALIEQLTAEPPNDPLTLNELRGMDGEPVWAGNEKEPQHFQWFLVDCGSAYKPFILINCRNNLMWWYMKSPAHPGGWTAYRRKPDGGGE